MAASIHPQTSGGTPTPNARSVHALLTPSARYFAVVVMAVSAFFPVHGLGFDLFLVHSFTGLPCPGCGMTRALAAFSQGDFTAALGLNPFVLLAWPTFGVLAVATLLPAHAYRRFESWVVARGSRVGKAYQLALYAFIAFGLARFAAFAAVGARFP